ncbi:ATP-binding protein [Streptomyces sp. GC420]|uniref:ATP-binding protein n=1 Tax=Streptomyces sp. GC420 TaxID=2697568 RepID=UPI00141507D4|nr:ATP-binding protein [Streptomyces sp. GC420]NBM16608.1 ATP-binding protein [Streptomyces sp. GC420]
MVRVESHPSDRESPLSRLLLLPAALMSAATGIGTALVTEAARIPVATTGALATLVVTSYAAEVARRGKALRVQRAEQGQRVAFLERRLAEYDEESVRLAKELMPAAVDVLRRGHSPAEVMADIVDGDERYRQLPYAQRELLLSVLRIVDDEEAVRDASQRAFVNIARRVQSIVHQQASELREMEEFHGRNPDVFDDLLRIDHGTALIGRLADSVSVLGGARPGRQWPKPVPLYSVLRGAMSRILEYRRVDLHSIAKVGIVGTAVEPVIHACAELLDNATRYSPPQTRVHVTAVEVQTGIAIEIEDGGVSLSEEARKRAERMLAEAQAGSGLKDLGDSPRLGLAVVGRICRMYNMQISLRQSAYGGVRVVLIVPSDIVTTAPATGIAHGIGAGAQPRGDSEDELIGDRERLPKKKPRKPTGPQPSMPAMPMPSSSALTASLGDDDGPVVTEWTPGGLPQRRSRLRGSFNGPVVPAPSSEPAPREPVHGGGHDRDHKDKEPGVWLDDFMRAVSGKPSQDGFTAGTDTSSMPAPETDETWDKGDLK